MRSAQVDSSHPEHSEGSRKAGFFTSLWPTFKQDTDGNGTWDLDQSRTHDKANELTEIASSSDHVAEDRAGNMTKLPKPDNWSAHFDLTCDAWNRLVKVIDGEATVATYAYDGRNFRTTKVVSGSTRHYYYSLAWQVLEERVGTSTYADRQSVWGLRYIDDLVLRDRDADGNTGTGNLGVASSGLEERLYSLQDANWNAAAIAGTDGAIQERYAYTAYGQPASFSSTFGSQPSSNYAWDTLYTGRQYDAESGLYYYHNRCYGAAVGRFLSRDPISYNGRTNLYEYVHDSPLAETDPAGLWPWSKACCNGVQYEPWSHCCENNRVVKKMSIWICNRPLGLDYGFGTGLYWGLPPNYVLPHCLQAKHSYVCCTGPNKNCFGTQAETGGKPTKKGDPIPVEEFPTGSCRYLAVCPATWTSKCINPKADTDYGWILPGYQNCTDWAWEGL